MTAVEAIQQWAGKAAVADAFHCDRGTARWNGESVWAPDAESDS